MIIRDSLFSPDPWGHGGCKRTAQISEILAEHQIESRFLDEVATLKDHGKIRTLLQGMVFLSRFPFRVRQRMALLEKFGRDCGYGAFFRNLPQQSVLLWENNHSFRSNLPFLARQAGLPVVAVPHNLESLVPTQRSFLSNRIAPHWTEEELRCLAACDQVFVISREEQWFLRLHGVPAEFLPYHPPLALAPYFSQIRAARAAASEKKGILMLGTANNAPTFQGMADRIRFFRKQPRDGITLHVVGSNTEMLAGEVGSSSNILIHGRIGSELLKALLVEVKAVLIHQAPTSGALTRIPEMLSAGIPVFADTNSARSWSGMDGLYCYENDEELEFLLQGEFPAPSQVAKPIAHERRFAESVRSYLV